MLGQVFLSDFVSIKPPTQMSQDESIRWLIDRHLEYASVDEQRTMDKRFSHFAVKKERIARRYFASAEVAKPRFDDAAIYSKENGEDMGYKSDFFAKHSIELFNQFYPSKISLPDHVIHVTCTGYVSPSAPQVMVSQFASPTKVTHAYHMGCYASLPAIRIAAGFIKSSESKKVDVVHTELCSLHMDAKVHTPEQIVIQTLFADGNIRYSLGASPHKKPSLELISQRERIIPHTSHDMRWELKKWGFAMTLSRRVPDEIASCLPDFLETLAADALVPKEQLIKESIFAVHPGGPKIIDSIVAQFDLCQEQVCYSQKILHDRGNMSSATLPHVWEEIVNSPLPDGKLVVSLVFGPGLSIFGSVFKYRSPQ